MTAQFIHLPPDQLAVLHRRLAEAVAPGGTLLVVGHHPSDVETGVRRPRGPGMLFTAEQVVAALDPAGWQVAVADSHQRQVPGARRRPVTVHDTVVRAVQAAPA